MIINEPMETEARHFRGFADAYAATLYKQVTHFYQVTRELAYFMVGPKSDTLYQVTSQSGGYRVGTVLLSSDDAGMTATKKMVKEFCAVEKKP